MLEDPVLRDCAHYMAVASKKVKTRHISQIRTDTDYYFGRRLPSFNQILKIFFPLNLNKISTENNSSHSPQDMI